MEASCEVFLVAVQLGVAVKGASENFRRVEALLSAEGRRQGLKCAMGVASFKAVHGALMPVQKTMLGKVADESLHQMLENGSFISIAYAYKPYAIEAIAHGSEKTWDKDRWNVYARAYARLNRALNETSAVIAEEIGGIAIPATVEGLSSRVSNVEDYYARRISHRVAAELSGVGWRGKNELIVNPLYGPAIRLASIVTANSVTRTPPQVQTCGDCRACLDVCKFLDHKNQLDNYREQCRKYLVHLALEDEVCGKCIKACLKDSLYADQFRL
jgi:epoxyqueuosine reductase QueG